MLNKHAFRVTGVVAACALLALGCEYFKDVVIPASDHIDPTLWARLYTPATDEQPSQDLKTTVNEPFDKELDGALWGKTIVAIAATLDGGGAKELTMTHGATVSCESVRRRPFGVVPQYICGEKNKVLHLDYAAKRASQDGEVGDTVSNGLWVGKQLDLAAVAESCGDGFRATRIKYGWGMSAEDFHGNKSSGAGGEVRIDNPARLFGCD